MEDKLLLQFNSDVAKDSTEIRIAFYANIGFFIEVVQMLEFNLRKLLCYELAVTEIEQSALTKDAVVAVCKKYNEYYKSTYLEKWTLGGLKSKFKKSFSINANAQVTLNEINDYRNQLVHKIFQNNVISEELRDSSTVRRYIEERLVPMTNKAVEVNKFVIKMIVLYGDDLHFYKQQMGINE